MLNDIRQLIPSHLLYGALEYPAINGQEQFNEPFLCPLCGIETWEGVKWKVTPRFSDLDTFAEKENIKFLCPACYFTLNHILDLHKPYLLNPEGLHILQFDDQAEKKVKLGKVKRVSRYYLMDFLLNAPTHEPWVLMLQSKMNPQHSLIRAKVNFGYSDTLWVSDGTTPHAIPREGLESLFECLIKVKKSTGLYLYLYMDEPPRKEHKEYELWLELEPILAKHRHAHYLPFVYERIIPPKKYMVEKEKGVEFHV